MRKITTMLETKAKRSQRRWPPCGTSTIVRDHRQVLGGRETGGNGDGSGQLPRQFTSRDGLSLAPTDYECVRSGVLWW